MQFLTPAQILCLVVISKVNPPLFFLLFRVTTSSETRSKKDLQLYDLPTACNVAVVPEATKFQSEQAETSIQSSNFAFAPPQTPESKVFLFFL